MLVATPCKLDGPRIISEVRKNHTNVDFRPKLAGELLVRVGGEQKWWPRRALVRNGQLLIGCGGGTTTNNEGEIRLPLRHLSLRSAALPNSLSLCRGQTVVLTIQTTSQQAFDIWVKTIAIELIRQTPLDDVKYLDIFTFTNNYCWNNRNESSTSLSNPNLPTADCNSNYLPTDQQGSDVTTDSCEVCEISQKLQTSKTDSSDEKSVVESLLKKCQNSENYVPVREKLILFESLCKLGRKVRSTEDVSCKSEVGATKRARSLHDLTNYQHRAPVRDICKYFEANGNGCGGDRFGTIARVNYAQLGQKC